ncbi:hypothetical protein BOH78_5006 [Pichia kudriavzevii]|uniref:Uncharacterized protein n=1 Tax=Pichia kudriavzevii TaxID=4909 RepID=A0A1V2LER3_PICKU|nr:hypothetical protein BOH78_5315 [Pichia kudriavzevii]ONH70537.1 hypothetical protein BOH78_5148 [Pichia kudriavzevii]ONH70743.1 hypothetical protein BOH78_5006 [Pichia kudriavzevii]
MEDSSNTHSKIKFENLSSKDVLPDYYVLFGHIIKYLVSKFRFSSRKGQQSHSPKLNPEKAAETPSFDAKHKGKRLDVAEVSRNSSANNQNSSELSEHCCVIGPNSYLQDC